MRLTLLTRVLLLIALTAAPSQAQSPHQPPAVELLIAGPQTLPLLARGKPVHFTATLINHSGTPILLLPPHPDWPDELWTTWQATRENGQPVADIPQEFIWCDPHGTMYAQRVFPMNAMLAMDLNIPPKQIADSDLVLLKPGERYQLPHIGDPRYYAKFLHPGKYHLSLDYAFQPTHYKLPPNSAHSSALAHASPIRVVSNSLELTLE
jgi:hypothetical protein